tara:strand:+ start:2270 stop:2875 length:606 start_codon:yes stop_codon:yes gene_type:complete
MERPSPSQNLQDLCVLELFESSGVFLDIGCWKAYKHSNTYLLEKNSWSGTCIDIVEKSGYSKRRCDYIVGDAVELLKDERFTNKTFDYVSFDIDENTNKALGSFLHNNIKFKFLTIEHDLYCRPKCFQDEQRQLLFSAGYEPLFFNIQQFDALDIVYEDWWYNPQADLPVINKLIDMNVLGSSYRTSKNILWLLQQARDKA